MIKEIIYRVPAGMIFVQVKATGVSAQGIYADGGSDRKGNQGVVSDTDSYGQMKWGENEDIGNKSQQQYRNDGVN